MPTKAAAARVPGHRAEREPEAGAVQEQVQEEGDRRRAGEHHEVVAADEERAGLEREVRERRERIGAVGEEDGDDLLELHPDREARDHRGEGRPAPDRPEADPLHVDPGQHRPGHGGGGDGHEAGLEFDEHQGAREDPEHDRGAVGEVETPHHPEDQGEADREQRVGRADEDAVEGVLDEVDDHRSTIIMGPPARRRGALPASDLRPEVGPLDDLLLLHLARGRRRRRPGPAR